jgi:hypothetical protein
MAQSTLQGAAVDPRGKQRRGRGMPEGMGADGSGAATGALCGCAHSAVDAAAGPRGGGAGQGGVIAAGSGQEPGGVGVRLPGGAAPVEGGIGQGAGAVLSARATGHMPHVARAVEGTPLRGERCREALSTAGEGGAGGARVPGRHGLEEALALCAAEHGREALCGLSSHDRHGVPVASQDLWVEETESARTEAHGAWREAIDVFAMPQRVWQVLCCEEVG